MVYLLVIVQLLKSFQILLLLTEHTQGTEA